MTWRDTWRETVESFVRELRAEDEVIPDATDDPVVRAVAGARAELTAVEREMGRVEERLGHEEAAAAVCARRRDLAERIADAETATIAARFQHRHEERAALLRRKRDVLRDERALARIALEELADLLRSAGAQAGEAADATVGDEAGAGPAAPRAGQPTEVDDAGFQDLEDSRRERAASERLDELKRRGV